MQMTLVQHAVNPPVVISCSLFSFSFSDMISSSPILFLGARKLDDFQDRQPTDFLPPRKILTNQREVQ